MAKRAASASKQSEGKAAKGKAAGAPLRPDAIIVLHGKERFLIEERTREAIAALGARHGETQVFRFDGETVELAAVLDELRSYSLMQTYKAVIVDSADEFMARPPQGDGEFRRAMERYAEKPVDHATLILRAESWRPGNFDKLVGSIVKCEELSEPKATAWCVERAASEHGLTLDHVAAAVLVDRVGAGLGRLDTELAKLSALVEPGGMIGREQVVGLVGMSREEQAWAVQDAVLTGDHGATLVKVHDLLEITQAAPEQLTWSLNDLARKMHAASQMARQGVNTFEIAKRLRLWGAGRDSVVNAAKRHSPRKFAQLLQAGIEADRRVKSGLATSRRSVEGFAVLLADSVRGAASASRR